MVKDLVLSLLWVGLRRNQISSAQGRGVAGRLTARGHQGTLQGEGRRIGQRQSAWGWGGGNRPEQKRPLHK